MATYNVTLSLTEEYEVEAKSENEAIQKAYQNARSHGYNNIVWDFAEAEEIIELEGNSDG